MRIDRSTPLTLLLTAALPLAGATLLAQPGPEIITDDEDVVLQPSDGNITPISGNQTGTGDANELRDDLKGLMKPYRLCYAENGNGPYAPALAAHYTVDRGLFSARRTVSLYQTKDGGNYRIKIYIDDEIPAESCNFETGECEDTGMPHEMGGSLKGKVVVVPDPPEPTIKEGYYYILLNHGTDCTLLSSLRKPGS